ncbi:DUF11 domain-containing protein [Psychrobacter jeotgali]|uniref:DUF11 domain-containing protein n=1 Tax=Psychrobacter jeotgali TaxID=179010 RepID=UPI00191ADF5D|nr:DUF11 domain-containing protein [Psychrobacter jeotgali]
MHPALYLLNSISSHRARHFMYKLFISMSLLIALLMSNSSFAIAPNPGAICPAGTQGSFTEADYSTLFSSYIRKNYADIAGSGSIPLQMQMSAIDTDRKTKVRVEQRDSGGYSFIRVRREADDDPTSTTNVTLDFRKSDTTEPLFLNNVALSVFEIDRYLDKGEGWDDLVTVTGKTKAGTTINGIIQSIAGSTVTGSNGSLYQSGNANRIRCRGTLATDCQGSIAFDQPVDSVTISFGNTTRITKGDEEQEIEFRVDSYCYAPLSYEISKDDGITSIGTTNLTNYTIKVTNTGGAVLNNVTLKDPIVAGLSKQSNITCDSADSTNSCNTVPTVAQLEGAGFSVPPIPIGQSYSINIPTRVTAEQGSTVTNTATISHPTLASKSASDRNTVTAIFDGGTTDTPAICPSGHKMYYIGANPPAFSPIQSQSLSSWVGGNTSKTFTFTEASGNKSFNISFSNLLDLNTSTSGGRPPFYSSLKDVTTSAINLLHHSYGVRTNHVLDVSVNRPVSKVGYKIQDIDSTIISGQVPYIEQVDVSSSNGQLTFNDIFHTINANRDKVTAIRGRNCDTNECTIDATWGYNPANTPLNLKHNNTFTERNSYHAVGYSDFYFCLAPPKLIVKKELEGNRINDTDSKRDQFEVKVTGGSIASNSFTTTGTAATVNNASSRLLSLTENTTYTITERVMNGSTLGDIANYKATYICTNNSTGSTTVMPTADMTYDAVAKTRSFTLSGASYGDEIICTITNTPVSYTFSGIVFNDNGGITAAEETKRDISTTFIGNKDYFNGIFDSATESGISNSNLSISLTDCNGNNITNTTAQTVSSEGRYRFVVPVSALLGKTEVCLVENEPSSWLYKVDTTPDKRKVTLMPNVYDYKTEKSAGGEMLRNLDFGEVKENNSALVLVKSQYVHQCDSALDYQAIPEGENPTLGFSINTIEDLAPNQCIAYRIQAYNRGHIGLEKIQITDQLQSTPVISVFELPAPLFLPTSIASPTVAYGTNGEITSNKFNLAATPSSATQPNMATLYFNTKYGNTVSNPAAP